MSAFSVVRARALVLVAVVALTTLSGCADVSAPAGRETPTATGAAASAKRPVSQDIIAFLSKARASHHNADLLEAKGDLPRAAGFIRAITDGPRPKDERAGLSPEVREVLADAHARLADLESRIGNFDVALKEVDAGLVHAPDVTHYRGHLFETRGVVFERRMQSFEKDGRTERADADRQDALRAFEMAITIQDEVITKLLPDPGGGPQGAPSGPPSAPKQ